MDNKEWIYDCIMEMLNDINIKIEKDEDSDRISECARDISDGFRESYYCSGDYVADRNLKESTKSKENNKTEQLEKQIELLEKFIYSKGFSFTIKGNSICETGMEYIGGDLMGSFERIIK